MDRNKIYSNVPVFVFETEFYRKSTKVLKRKEVVRSPVEEESTFLKAEKEFGDDWWLQYLLNEIVDPFNVYKDELEVYDVGEVYRDMVLVGQMEERKPLDLRIHRVSPGGPDIE